MSGCDYDVDGNDFIKEFMICLFGMVLADPRNALLNWQSCRDCDGCDRLATNDCPNNEACDRRNSTKGDLWVINSER